ncbi:MAG: hypothetical protein ACFC1C_00285 [Candidatus Malihini olakiniferum]
MQSIPLLGVDQLLDYHEDSHLMLTSNSLDIYTIMPVPVLFYARWFSGDYPPTDNKRLSVFDN